MKRFATVALVCVGAAALGAATANARSVTLAPATVIAPTSVPATTSPQATVEASVPPTALPVATPPRPPAPPLVASAPRAATAPRYACPVAGWTYVTWTTTHATPTYAGTVASAARLGTIPAGTPVQACVRPDGWASVTAYGWVRKEDR